MRILFVTHTSCYLLSDIFMFLCVCCNITVIHTFQCSSEYQTPSTLSANITFRISSKAEVPTSVHCTCKYDNGNCYSAKKSTKTPGLQSASELYRRSDRRLSAKLVPTLADRGCRVVSAMNPHGR
jgi:hypothetical protein